MHLILLELHELNLSVYKIRIEKPRKKSKDKINQIFYYYRISYSLKIIKTRLISL